MPGRGQESERRIAKLSLKDERGVALAEFALILPLLMLLLLGMLDFGKAFTMWIDETHLANQAGRYAAVNKYSGATVESNLTGFQTAMEADGDTKQLRDSFASGAPNGIRVCFPFVNGSPPTGAIGDAVRVDARATYHFLDYLALKVPFLSLDAPLSAHSVMRIESAYTPSFANAHACS